MEKQMIEYGLIYKGDGLLNGGNHGIIEGWVDIQRDFGV